MYENGAHREELIGSTRLGIDIRCSLTPLGCLGHHELVAGVDEFRHVVLEHQLLCDPAEWTQWSSESHVVGHAGATLHGHEQMLVDELLERSSMLTVDETVWANPFWR